MLLVIGEPSPSMQVFELKTTGTNGIANHRFGTTDYPYPLCSCQDIKARQLIPRRPIPFEVNTV